ncbi:hypothetical protein BV20DRAFT_1055219 [Pilatotrama ljubarskyi]|nr:hypothetical protein BV20DRAFT_1055219 [Pilatotrama ljubarskyi]
MHLIFPKNSPTNSLVIDSATQDVLYNISTTSTGLVSQKTVIRDARWREIAHWNNPHMGLGEITLRGETKQVSDWLHKDGRFTSTRKFLAPNGKMYAWREILSNLNFKLVDCGTGEAVGRSHRSRLGIFFKPRKMGLEVADDLVPILDDVILSFIILERNMKDATGVQRRSYAAAMSFFELTCNAGYWLSTESHILYRTRYHVRICQ